jgi:hypothetical protein
MALTLGTMEMCTRALGIGKPCHTGRPARFFFMLEAHSPHGVAGRVGAQSPPHREAGSRAMGHVAL